MFVGDGSDAWCRGWKADGACEMDIVYAVSILYIELRINSCRQFPKPMQTGDAHGYFVERGSTESVGCESMLEIKMLYLLILKIDIVVVAANGLSGIEQTHF